MLVTVSCVVGVAIDGNNNEDKERFIKLVKKRGKVKALEEELYSRCFKNLPLCFGLPVRYLHLRRKSVHEITVMILYRK